MSRTGIVLLVVAPLILAGGVWFWSWFAAKPDPFDTTADMLALEREMIGDAYNAEAWLTTPEERKDVHDIPFPRNTRQD